MKRYQRVILLALLAAGVAAISPGRAQDRGRPAPEKKPAPVTAAIPPFTAPEYIPIEAPALVPEGMEFTPSTGEPPTVDTAVQVDVNPPFEEDPNLVPLPDYVVIGDDGNWYEAVEVRAASRKFVRGKKLKVKTRKLARSGVKVEIVVKNEAGTKVLQVFELGVSKSQF